MIAFLFSALFMISEAVGGNPLAIDPNNSQRVYIGGSGYGQDAVWVSEDAGKTFRALEGLPQLLVYGLSVSADGNLIAAATDALSEVTSP